MTGAGRRRGPDDYPQATGNRPRLALPGNLSGSLRHLDDEQLETLLRTLNAEAARRGWKSPRADLRSSRRDVTGTSPRSSPRKRAELRTLTPGQEKVVRAALTAGVGPVAIARQAAGIHRSRWRQKIARSAHSIAASDDSSSAASCGPSPGKRAAKR